MDSLRPEDKPPLSKRPNDHPLNTEAASSSLVGLRAALIGTLAVLAGIIAGLLAAWAGHHPGDAILYGGAAAAAATAFFNWVISRR